MTTFNEDLKETEPATPTTVEAPVEVKPAPVTTTKVRSESLYVDQFGRITTTPPPAPPSRADLSKPYDPNVKYIRDSKNCGSDESGQAWEVRGGKVYSKTTGKEVGPPAQESRSSFGTITPWKMGGGQ